MGRAGRSTSIIWRTVVSAGAMLGTAACGGTTTTAQEPAPVAAMPEPATPVEPAEPAEPMPVVPAEPEPPPPPVMITITVTSTPAGADVFIDGELRGTTPLKLELPQGSADVNLKVLRDGYVEQERTVSATADAELAVALEKAKPRPRPPSGKGKGVGRGFVLS